MLQPRLDQNFIDARICTYSHSHRGKRADKNDFKNDFSLLKTVTKLNDSPMLEPFQANWPHRPVSQWPWRFVPVTKYFTFVAQIQLQNLSTIKLLRTEISNNDWFDGSLTRARPFHASKYFSILCSCLSWCECGDWKLNINELLRKVVLIEVLDCEWGQKSLQRGTLSTKAIVVILLTWNHKKNGKKMRNQ